MNQEVFPCWTHCPLKRLFFKFHAKGPQSQSIFTWVSLLPLFPLPIVLSFSLDFDICWLNNILQYMQVGVEVSKLRWMLSIHSIRKWILYLYSRLLLRMSAHLISKYILKYHTLGITYHFDKYPFYRNLIHSSFE